MPMRWIRPFVLARWFYSAGLFRVRTQARELYLTFDDGPSDCTIEIVDLLRRYNACATFFCTGLQIEKHPDLLEFVTANGHVCANHGYQHVHGFRLSTREYVKLADQNRPFFTNNFFRPPYGELSPRQYLQLRTKYRLVFWDVMCYDFELGIDAGTCFKLVRENAKSGSIIVFHDSPRTRTVTLQTLELVLNYFSRQGYRFKSLEV